MTLASENRLAFTTTVVSLTAEANELETRVIELRQALAELDEQIRAVSGALLRIHGEERACGQRTE
ncbi:hypothetical protein [Streptomyces sp. NBC_00259]|uniref:hypothetical protein n=1 Tax=Streptomyces sp. NBC_00259 TaxID=2903643 RepID=UPI002E2BDDA9|nr:hypothetical protein [Streptomyces sp. NBC_00259]